MIRHDNELRFDAPSPAVHGGRSPARAGERCKERHGTT